MKQSKPRPLDKILLRILALQLFLPSLILILLAIVLVGQRVTRELGNQQLQQARSLAYTIDDYLEHTGQTLGAVVQVAETATPEELIPYIQATRKEYGHFDTLYRLNANGVVVALTPFDSRYEGLDMSRQPYFQQARTQADVMISQPFPSLHTGQQTVYMTKMLSDGGMVVGELNLGALQEAITAVGGEQYFIADRSGTLLAHPQLDLVAQQVNVSNMRIVQRGLTGEATLLYATGETFVLGSAAQVERTGWIVVAQIPLIAAFTPYIPVVIPVLLLVPVIWLAMMWSLRQQLVRHIVAPLARLSQGADALAAGDFAQGAALAAIPAAFAEVSALAADFERMSQAIQARQSALQESEEKYRTILENIEDGYYEVDLGGNFVFFNDAMCRDLGYSKDELMGMNNRQYMDDETAKKVFQIFNTVYCTGEPVQAFDWELVRRDKTTRFVDTSISLIRDSGGEPIGFRGIARDITEQKQAEREIRQRTAQLEALRQVGLELTAQLEPDVLLRSIVSQAIELLGGTRGGIYLYRPERDVIEWSVSVGESPVPIGAVLHRGEGLAGKVWETGEPLTVDDYQHWEERATIYDGFFIEAVASAPVRWGGEFLGVLNVDSEAGTTHTFSPADVELLSLFATQAAIAIRNARLYEEAHRRAEELVVLNDLAQALTARLDVDAALEEAHRGVSRLMDTTNFYIGLYDPEKNEIAFRYDVSASGEDAHITLLPADQGLSGYIIRNRTSVLIQENLIERLAEMGVELVGEPALSWLGVPLLTGDRVLGVMAVQSYTTPHAYDEHDRDLLTAIASQTTVALDNARLYEKAQRSALEQRTLREAALALMTTLDRNEVTERILAQLQQVVPYDTASVQLLKASPEGDRREERLEIVGGRGFPNLPDLLGISFPVGGDNPNSEVIRTRASYIVEDAPAVYEEFRREPHAQANIHSWLGVPMLVGDRLVGMIALDRREAGFYTEEHAQLALTFAAQAAVAIENARLYEQAQQKVAERRLAEERAQNRADHLSVLNTVITAAAAATDLPNLLEITLGHILTALRLEMGAIWLPGQHATRGLPPEASQIGAQVAKVAWTAVPDTLIVEDWQQVTDDKLSAIRPLTTQFGIRASITVPFLSGASYVGGLSMASPTPRPWSAEEIALAEAVGRQLGTAAERLRLFRAEWEQRELAEALEQAAAAVSSTLDPDEVLDRILEQVEQVVPGDAFNIMLVEDGAARTVRWRGYERLSQQVFDSPLSVAQHPTLMKMEETGGPIVIPDTNADTDWVSREDLHWMHSYVGVPIRIGDETVGFLNVNGTRAKQFGPTDARRLQALASHAATAIENARLFEKTQQRVAELETLQRTSLQLTSSLDLTAVLDSIVESALTLIGATDCHIYLYNEETETFTFGTVLWDDGRREAAVPSLRANGLTATVAREGQPIVISDAHHHPLYTTPEAQKWDVYAIAGFPLKRANKVLGVFTIAFLKPHTFSPEEVRVLGLLTSQAAIAIENAQLYQQLRDHAEQLEQRVQERTVQIQAQYARQEAILCSASDGIIVTDADGKIIQTNPVAQTWLTQTLSPEDAARLREAVTAGTTGEEQPETILELTGLDLELKSAPILGHGIKDAAAVVAVHDVSHLKALDRIKSRFVTNVSHELRTPITTIKLYAALMQNISPEDKRWSEYLNTLAQEADRQALLVQDIMQISRIDAGRLEMSPSSTSLNELTGRVFASGQVVADQQGVTIEHHPAKPGPVTLVDPDRMMQVLTNLVENAIRYTPEGGKVTVSTGTKEAKGRVWATATVADTGMGIPDDELAHIFERFFRGVTPRSMQISGTGLGLALVKEIVELHGGWVTVESEVDVGTTFTVWLPCAD